MKISENIIREIREKIHILDIVREYLPNLKKVGHSYSTLCPFHDDKNPSFYVAPSKEIFHCFGCEVGGDVIKFVALIEKVSFPEAVKKLAERAGVKLKWASEEESTDKKIYDVLNDVSTFYHYLLKKTDKAKHYVEKRCLSDETIEKFMIGYAPPDGDVLVKEFAGKYGLDILNLAGVVNFHEVTKRPYDYMRDRIIFPIHNRYGRVIAFGGRRLHEDENIPLYLNTPETCVFSKNRIVYGFFHAKDSISKLKSAILVEGYFDVLMLHQYGFSNVVAPMGTAFTLQQATLLGRYAKDLIIVFDPDESGIKAAMRAGELALEAELNVRIALIPEICDPDEYIRKNGKEKMGEVINLAVDLFDFEVDRMISTVGITSANEKTKIIESILPLLQLVKSHVTRQEAIKKLSKKLSLPEDVLRAELMRFLKKRKQELPITDQIKVFSVEEELLLLCIKHPEVLETIPEDILLNNNHAKIFQVLRDSSDLTSQVDILSEDDSKLLRRLICESENRNYDSPQKTLNALLRDLEIKQLELKRKKIMEEIKTKLNNEKSIDKDLFNDYKNVDILLKKIKYRR